MADIAATAEALAIAVRAGHPVLLWGAPGTGKTSVVRGLADAADLPCEVVVASIREPTDFSGLPVVAPDGSVRFAPPAWAARLAEAGRGVLFLDELSTAPPAVQAALLRVVLDRVVGDIPLPNSVSVIAAANPPEQAAGGWDLAPPLANRFVHLHWETDGRTVANGLAFGFAVPSVPPVGDTGTDVARWRGLVAGFLSARPMLHLQVPGDEHQAGRAWPSPRSWEAAALLAGTADAAHAAPEVRARLVAGCVGEGVAIELLAWVDDLDLPDPEALLADPTGMQLPERDDRLFAVLASVVAVVVEDLTVERWNAAWEVLALAAKRGTPDVAATAAMELARRQPPGASAHPATREFLPLLRQAGLV